ncbi:hypothetical protein COBT_003823, partial [Conglomerata obtusa]
MTEENNLIIYADVQRKKHKLITKETIENLIRLLQNEAKPNQIQEILNISKNTFKRLRVNYEKGLYNDLSIFKNQHEKISKKRKNYDIE